MTQGDLALASTIGMPSILDVPCTTPLCSKGYQLLQDIKSCEPPHKKPYPHELERHKKKCTVLIIGCGVAGNAVALSLAKHGIQVTILSCAQDPNDCATYWAQGGIIYKGHNDSSELLAQDVYRAGAGLCEDAAVHKLASQGPKCVDDLLLDICKVPFTRDESGELALTLEASHNRSRILYKADHSGQAISTSMNRAVEHAHNIHLITSRHVFELVKNQHGSCVGALAVTRSGEIEFYHASYTVLATGGIGDLYQNTSNPVLSKGEGLALAARAGAKLKHLQYVQFHPTTLYVAGERRFLLTEALRGEGSILRDRSGRAFAKDYDPAKELAPRDVVTRMILMEMAKQKESCMYLDISHKEPEWIRARFPTIYRHCLARNIDITKDVMPIVPAAHYHCGGIEVDLNGHTTVDALFAVGEVSCTGLHGANRLASSSLLEGLVWGTAAADCIQTKIACGGISHGESLIRFPEVDRQGKCPPPLNEMEEVLTTMRCIMWELVGPIRTRSGLSMAVDKLSLLKKRAERIYMESRISFETVECYNATFAAKKIALAAMECNVSAGTHFVVGE